MTVLCHIDDIEHGTSKGFELGEQRFFAVKWHDQIYLYRNHCPHLGIELNWQEDKFLDMDGSLIQCSTHGALFLIEDGQCVAGPCQGERLEQIPFEIHQGNITISR